MLWGLGWAKYGEEVWAEIKQQEWQHEKWLCQHSAAYDGLTLYQRQSVKAHWLPSHLSLGGHCATQPSIHTGPRKKWRRALNIATYKPLSPPEEAGTKSKTVASKPAVGTAN